MLSVGMQSPALLTYH